MNNKSIIRLKLLGFSETDKSRFEAILSLAETKLDRPWQIVSEPTADFYLLSARLITQLDHDKLLQSLPRDRCIFYTTRDISHNRYELRIDSNYIPRCSALVNLFNELSAGIENNTITAIPQQPLSAQNTAPIPDSNPLPADSGADSFDPGQGLPALLLTTRHTRHTPQIISLTEQIDYPAIYLDDSNNYYCAVGPGQMEA